MTHIEIQKALKTYEEVVWCNPNKKTTAQALDILSSSIKTLPSIEDIREADQRLRRFSNFFKLAFDQTQEWEGLIESSLTPIPGFQNAIISFLGGRVIGDWSLKSDNTLPISGSVKARGGVYEVIKYAEKLALESGLLKHSDDYSILLQPEFKNLYKKHTLLVGSTGNLGLSIGTIGKALGFNVIVHMSQDAKAWKIDKLKSLGVKVLLHEFHYTLAVEEARKMAQSHDNMYFIDDENSLDLFIGYAVAALRLKEQVDAKNITVDKTHPLFVYLPCGVGGAPGGIAYGLKLIFGDAVYIFLAEPTHAPCMLLGMATEEHESISLTDLGIDLKTEADGLAVGRPSGFVSRVLSPLIDGIYTVSDDKLFFSLFILHESQGIDLEPSATASLMGPMKLFYNADAFKILVDNQLLEHMENAHHISWGTGGSMVPSEIMKEAIEKGASKAVTF